jgi:hypothetical protein
MASQQKMVAEARLFIRLGLFACIGIAFYHAHLFLGLFNNALLFKGLAIIFLLTALPLPIIALNNRKLFPELRRSGKTILTMASLALLMHHFLMTFIFVLILKDRSLF